MLLGMIRPSRGDGTVLGKRIANAEENRQLRHKVAYVAESKPLYGYMTVQQTLPFASSFYADCLAFTFAPSENDFRISGVEKIRIKGCKMSIFASSNAMR
jgi:ABC-type multidrug transport system ATPase subunit